MLKSYNDLRKIDVTPYCDVRKEGKENLLYLNWAKCIELLHENGAETVFFEPVRQTNGSSLIASTLTFTDKNGNTNNVYETQIRVVIDKKEIMFQGPVMNGANPVKDNSMSQQRLWNCQCRLFVKAVAIHTGLGFDLWLKNEDKENKLAAAADVYHDIGKVKERVLTTLTAIQKESGMSLADIAKALGRTEDELNTYMKQYNILMAVEHNLYVLLNKVRAEKTNDKQ